MRMPEVDTIMLQPSATMPTSEPMLGRLVSRRRCRSERLRLASNTQRSMGSYLGSGQEVAARVVDLNGGNELELSGREGASPQEGIPDSSPESPIRSPVTSIFTL
jgi:hypothetical protein